MRMEGKGCETSVRLTEHFQEDMASLGDEEDPVSSRTARPSAACSLQDQSL